MLYFSVQYKQMLWFPVLDSHDLLELENQTL